MILIQAHSYTKASQHWNILKQKGSEVKCWSFILFQCSESTVHHGYPSSWTTMFLNEDTPEQIWFYLCKLCLWINCRITATSWSLHEYCGTVHHLFCHLFESHASVTISSKQQAPYSYHITILMEHIRKALVGFEVFLWGKGRGKF